MNYGNNSGSAFQALSRTTAGVYNAGRRVLQQRRNSTLSSSEYGSDHNFTLSMPRLSNPSTLFKSGQPNPYMFRIAVMVDEVTEAGPTDDNAARQFRRIIEMLTDKKSSGMTSETRQYAAGEAVATALRQRLHSEDHVAVRNTLILLDDIMRTVPNFFRYIANEKFFRSMWCFVVLEDKKNVVSFFRAKPSLVGTDVGTDGYGSAITKRILILIRAWAEELSIMFHGRSDPDASFLINCYRNKRTRIPFPEVPKSRTPWVCRVPPSDETSEYANFGRNKPARAGSSQYD